jgi:hypothetical protein
MAAEKTEGAGVTRLSFIKTSAGVAAGVAAASVPIATAQAREQAAVETRKSSRMPPHPVTAVVRNAKQGEVTVLSGTGAKTYRDKALVKRLLAAAPKH